MESRAVLLLSGVLALLICQTSTFQSRTPDLSTLRNEFPELMFNLEQMRLKNVTLSDSMSSILDRGSNLEIRTELLNMMHTIFQMMHWQGLVDDHEFPVWSLIDYAFDLITDYVRRKDRANSYDGECPYSYDKMGDMCLVTDLTALNLNFHEARLYCQLMKGGDLAIFKDANQFHNILKYVRKSDPEFDIGFWIGASAGSHRDYWTFINGEYVPYGTPFWGKSGLDNGNQAPSSEDGKIYAFLNPWNYHYLDNTDFALALDKNTVPLCQYFPGRGHNSHHGYHASGYYHEGSDAVINEKLATILSLSKKAKEVFA